MKLPESDVDAMGRQGAPRLLAASLALAALLGIALRVALLADKPFWRDEAWLAWVVELPPPARADVSHVIPVGFLAAVRALAALPGNLPPEVTYRLIPLAAGIASMALLPLLARRLGAPMGAVACAGWVGAGMPALVYYARELKPYALDALWAALLCLLASDLVGRRMIGPGAGSRWLALVTLAALGPWVSYGAVFPTAAALAWIGWSYVRSVKTPIALLAVVGAAAVAGAALASAYVLYLRQQIAHPLLPLMWDDAWQPGGLPSALARARPFVDVFRVPLQYLFPTLWPLAAFLAVIGLAALPPRGREALLWSWLPSAGLAAACAVGQLYVVAHGRFLLFLAPALIVCVATGLVKCCEVGLGRRGRRAGAAIAAALSAAWAVAWGAQSVQRRLHPEVARPRPFVFDVIQDVEPLVAWLDAERIPAAMLLVGRYAADPFRYYSKGRLGGARLMSFRGHGYGAEFADWLAERPEGWLLLVEDEAGSYRRTLESAAFRIQAVTSARGALVWRVTREASPPRRPRDSRAGAAGTSGSGT